MYLNLFQINKRVSACLLGALLLLISSCDGNDAAEQADRANDSGSVSTRVQALRVLPVRVGTLREEAHYLGSIEPASTLTVLARAQGVLSDFPLAEGALVEAGQLAARIDAPDMNARVERVRAELRRAQLERDHICRTQEEDSALVEQAVIPSIVLEASTTNCAAASEAIQGARAALREAESAQSRLIERVPIRSRVVGRMAEPGEAVAPGRALLRLAAEGFEVRVRVAEVDLMRGVSEGSRVRVALPNGREFEAEVLSLSPESHRVTRSREVTIATPEELADELWAGMSVDIWFVFEEIEDAISVPNDALLSDTDSSYAVFVARGDSLERVVVRRLLSAGGWTATEPALGAGDEVVVGSLANLFDGQEALLVRDGGQ